ncbi:MAG: hypothetical protein ABIW76_22480 [Fibrobacteria bacterium]
MGSTIRLWGAAAGMLGIFASGCARHPEVNPDLNVIESRSCQEPEELVDVLARFATALNKKDYHLAVSYLSKEDQAKMVVGDGIILDDMKRKLSALNLQALSNDPRIDLVKGKLTGVFDCLPCLDQGEPQVVAKDTLPAAKPAEDDGLVKARAAMAKDFYHAARAGKWQKAAGLVHPQEWSVFLDAKGSLTGLSKRRLAAIQECDLEALTLTGGLLTGVVVLLDPPISDLYLRAMLFYDAVRDDKIDSAIGMILESEKRFFLDKEGKPRADRVASLKAMDRTQWRRLYLYHDVLIGVAEAAVGYQNL